MAEDTPNDVEREQAAFRALVVSAFVQDDCNDPAANHSGPNCDEGLNEDDRRAVAALGDDLIDRILAGETIAGSAPKRLASPTRGHLVAMNRGGDLTDEARKEMERKIQDLKEKGSEEEGS